MKIGEKVYCIKTRDLSYDGVVLNKSGKIYEVISNNVYTSSDNAITISNDINEDSYYYTTVNDGRHYYLYEYFITVKEQRRLKIKKLNDNKTSDIL